MAKKLTKEEFVAKAKKVHGNKYLYYKVDYKNSHTDICIVCPEHRDFWQTPNNHLNGAGCPECAKRERGDSTRSNTAEFIIKARLIYGNKYDYSKVEYKSNKTKVCIICPEHGEFWETPKNHLVGYGCPKCKEESKALKIKRATEHFIALATIKHGGKYSYPNTVFNGWHSLIKIECPIHGEFEQIAGNHLYGRGCQKCGRIKAKHPKTPFSDFVARAKAIHGDKFDYSLAEQEYDGLDSKIPIICPKHDIFWQRANSHLEGIGCPWCKESKGEREVAKWLGVHQFKYEREYRITPTQVLFGRKTFIVDFYLPDHNTFIEFHGAQHYERQSNWQTEEVFAEQQDRDRRLREYCKQNNIRLIEIPYTMITEIDNILKRQLTLF